ncbi:MAG TPA: PmoA family protein [Chryseolinea sp.]
MHPISFLAAILCIFSHASLCGQSIAVVEVQLPQAMNGLAVPAKIDLDAITTLPDAQLTLMEVQGSKRTPVPFQIENRKSRALYWMVDGESDGLKKRTYELIKATAPKNSKRIQATKKDGVLLVHSGQKNLLQYNFKTVYPPQGIDTAFRRSAFIHPLWTPTGKVLTRIQPPDHYHHYGIWNPWTHVLFEGDTVDFWNIKGRQGTVRFGKFVSVTEGPVYAEYQALHEHVAFKKGKEKVALNEVQTVRVYRPEDDADNYIVDITIELTCASSSPFLILEYRYAGLGWRATEKWNKSNSEVLTSEGKVRKGADGTTAKWVIIQGALDNEYGGAVMMSYPANYNHPEPLRIWPEESNGGEMFAMFAPTKTKDWLLEPGKTYELKYRFNVFSGHFTKEKAESGWQYYSTPATATVKMN